MKRVRIFVSSPGDVAAEREKAREIFDRLQLEFSGLLEIDPYYWEHEPMFLHADYQSNIEPPSKFDVCVCFLWGRLGIRLNPAIHRKDDWRDWGEITGTISELLDALDAWHQSKEAPKILLYRRKTDPVIPVNPPPPETAENLLKKYRALQEFLNRLTEEDEFFVRATNGYTNLEDFETKFDTHMRKVLEGFLPEGETASRRVPKSWKEGSPFRGLRYFDFEHAAIFFGRTRATEEVLNGLRQQAADKQAFALVFGGSGVGKSSLVRAGVLPLLVKPGVIEGVGLWRRAVMRPSEVNEGDLFDALAAALMRPEALAEIGSDGTTVSKLASMLREKPDGVGMLIKGALSQAAQKLQLEKKSEEQPRARFALVIDQLEELFTVERLADQREGFLRAIDALARSGYVWVLATLRSDFYSRCEESPLLMELKKGAGQYHLQPPNEIQLGQMIRMPATAAGLEFEKNDKTGERLEDFLRDAAVKNTGALPLLEFALEELYQKRDKEKGLLTIDAYRTLGGVEGALGKRAEQSFRSVSQPARESFGDVFLQLVTIGTGEGEPAVRQWARKTDIEASRSRRELIDRLIADRLLFADRTEQGVHVITISHEAMLASWPRLQKWVSEHRKILKIRAQVTADAARWRENERNPDFLYKEKLPLEKAKRALDANCLGKEEQEFVEASLVAAAEQKFRASLASGEQMHEVSQRLRDLYPDLRIKVMRDLLRPDSEPHARRNVVSLLGDEREPALSNELLNIAMSDRESWVRRAAAISLAKCDDDELYAALESRLQEEAGSVDAVRALAGVRVAADRWVPAPVFDGRFNRIPRALRRQILRQSWSLRFWEALPVLPFIALPAAIFAAIAAGLFMAIPGAFNWGITQATANPAMAAFHGAVGGIVWAGIITCGIAAYRLIFGRDLILGSYFRPVGALGAGALFGFLSSIVVVIFCIVTVYTVPSLEIMGWIRKTDPPRVSLSRDFFSDLFVATRFGWAHLITGMGLGVGMAMMTNGLQASGRWRDFLQYQERLSSLGQARRLIWNIIKLALPYSWPVPLVMAIAAIIAWCVPIRNPDVPKATAIGIAQGLVGDCATQAVGGFFGIVGMGLGIVILRYGMNVEGRKT